MIGCALAYDPPVAAERGTTARGIRGSCAATNPWTYWILSRAACVLLLTTVTKYNGISVESDVRGVYFRAARNMFAGLVPYRDFHYEYPPGTLPVVALARLISGDHNARFTAVWVLLMLAFDAVVLSSLMRIAAGDEGAQRRWPAVTLWVFGGTAMFWILLHNDLVVIAPVLLGLELMVRRPAWAGANWAFATVAKIWPGPLMLGIALTRRSGRWPFVLGAAGVLVVTAAAVALPGATHAMVTYLLDYQGHRPIEFESTWADIRWIHATLSGVRLHTHFQDGAPGLLGGHSALFARLGYDLTTAVTVLAVLLPPVVRWRFRRQLGLRFWVWLMAAYVLAALLVAPVLSAQYAVWSLGAGAAVLAVDGSRAAVATGVSCGLVSTLTTAEFPFGFTALMQGRSWPVIALTARNLSIALGMCCALVGLVLAVRAGGPAGEPVATSRARRGGAAAGSRRR